MILPRRRYWVPFVVLIIFVGVVRLDLHYHVIGLFRGDAYYRGMPTSFWRDVASHEITGHDSPRWLESLLRRRLPDRGPTTIFQNDPAAQSVVVQLAIDPATNRHLRLKAFEKCSGPALAQDDCTAVRHCLNDDDRSIRHAAAHLLLRLNKADDALQLLLRELTEEFCNPGWLPQDRRVRHDAYSWLHNFPRLYPFVEINVLERRIDPLLKHEDREIRNNAEELLKHYSETRNSKNAKEQRP